MNFHNKPRVHVIIKSLLSTANFPMTHLSWTEYILYQALECHEVKSRVFLFVREVAFPLRDWTIFQELPVLLDQNRNRFPHLVYLFRSEILEASEDSCDHGDLLFGFKVADSDGQVSVKIQTVCFIYSQSMISP